jgi:2-C-methyl-D-erythritol 4-phosphate cytidylyltransferase/2-C-methyl-D-erythritol 4-phosphate cytidylyltransferase/2-C-methyl-D-erythritol 2,4-cyclodiphosphate synthase
MTSSVVDPDPSAPARCYALVPCAGVGERAGPGGPKQYRQIAGRSVVAHTLAALAQVPRLVATLVVLSPEDREFEAHAVGAGVPLERSGPGELRIARVGGATRAATVAQGLAVLTKQGAQPGDWVLVHDAARCLVQPADIDRLIDTCLGDPVGGLLALPLADTLKREAPVHVDMTRVGAASPSLASPGPRAALTLDRRGLWQAQTPQMFRLGLLREALAAAGDAVTDEASAIESLGLAPRLVTGALENFKLTWPADFALAERLLRTRP